MKRKHIVLTLFVLFLLVVYSFLTPFIDVDCIVSKKFSFGRLLWNYVYNFLYSSK